MNTKTQSNYELPSDYSDSYTADDKQLLAVIYDWLNSNETKHNKSWLCERSGMPEGTFAGVLRGKYISSPTNKLQQIQQATLRANERDLRGVNNKVIAETTVFKKATAMFVTAQAEHELTAVCGMAGIGKTVAAKEFEANNADAIYIRALPDMCSVTLLTKLIEVSGAVGVGRNGYSKDAMLSAIIDAFSKRDATLLIDEAENMRDGCFEELRVLRDEAHIGICLIGEAALEHKIKSKSKFNKLASRIGPNTGVMKSISRNDSDNIVRAHFGEVEDKKVFDTFWKVCSGSARRLEEKIIRKIISRRLLDQHELTPDLINAVAQQLLKY